MSGRYLLDTNIVIALFAQDSSVQRYLSQAREVFISIIVLGELYYGAYKSAHVESNLAVIDELASSLTVLEYDKGTAQRYGQIKSILRSKGRPIPENDIWLAAVARQHQLTLVSKDEHFKEVEGLVIEAW